MSNCKYCNKEIMNDGDFCGNCGFINFYHEENASKRLLKQFKYLFINPVAFVRTSILANPIFTGVTAIMIIVIQLITKKVIELNLKSNVKNVVAIETSTIYAIIATLVISAIAALFMFGIVKYIFKKNVNYISLFNLTLSIQLISTIINIIGAILGVLITPYLFAIFKGFGMVICLLLMYQGIKDFVNSDIFISLVTLIGSFAGVAVVTVIILKRILENSLTSF